MREFLLSLVIGLLVFGGVPAFADATTTETATTTAIEATTSATLDLSTLVAKLPSLSQAILYSYDKNETKYAMSFTVMSFLNDHINIDAMYVPSQEIGALVSVKLGNLGNWIKFPLMEYIEFQPFVYYGLDSMGDGSTLGEPDYGFGAKIVSIKF